MFPIRIRFTFALTKGERSKLHLRNSLRWSIYVIGSVDNTKLPCYTLPPTQHHSFLRNLPLYSCFQHCLVEMNSVHQISKYSARWECPETRRTKGKKGFQALSIDSTSGLYTINEMRKIQNGNSLFITIWRGNWSLIHLSLNNCNK